MNQPTSARIYCTPYRSLTPSAQTVISAAHASSAGVSRSSRPKTRRSSAIDIKAKGGVDPQELPSNVLYQARVLMLFTAQLTLHRLLPPVISNEAVNAMYDDLSEGFYDNVMEGASFSIYYLAVRKTFNISANIGKGFAMLCGDEDSDEYAKIGTLVYNLSDEYVTKRVNEAGFKKLS